MKDFYSIIHEVNVLHASNSKIRKKFFFALVLNGNEDLKGLLHQGRMPELKDLENIAQAFENEIKRTPIWDFYYIWQLKNLLIDLQKIIIFKKEQSRADGMFDSKVLENVYDKLFQQTVGQYNGHLILPINQGMDFRLSGSMGACAGYVAEWSRCLLHEEKPFGVDIKQPGFKPVPYSSPAGNRYPDLNHLAIVTTNISTFQRIQNNHDALSAQFSKKNAAEKITRQVIHRLSFYKNVKIIAEQLANLAHENPQNVYTLSLFSEQAGHSTGFHKNKDGTYHFLDANSGWFSFKNKEDFVNWLPFYFKQLGYDKRFPEYAIKTYGIHPKSAENSSLGSSVAEFGADLLYILRRSFYYLTVELFNTSKRIGGKVTAVFSAKVQQNNLATQNAQVIPPMNNIKYSQDDIQIGGNKQDNTYEAASYSTIAGLLFHPLHKSTAVNPVNCREKAAISASAPFLKPSVSIEKIKNPDSNSNNSEEASEEIANKCL